jgi:hypothetical protein
MKNKLSMASEGKQSRVDPILCSSSSRDTGKKEETEQKQLAAKKAAEIEEDIDENDRKDGPETHASSSKDSSKAKGTDGPNRLKEGRVSRWIDLGLRGVLSAGV